MLFFLCWIVSTRARQTFILRSNALPQIIIAWLLDENWHGDCVKCLSCSCEDTERAWKIRVTVKCSLLVWLAIISQGPLWHIIIVSKLLGSKVWPISKPKQQQKRGQDLLVLIYSFSRNTAVLILVYLSFNLAAAPALQSKRHSTAQICCDVSKTLTLVDGGKKKSPMLRPEAVWLVNHLSFPIKAKGRSYL